MSITSESMSPRLKLSVCAVADLPEYAHQGVTHILSIDRPGFPTPTPDWFGGVHEHVFFQDVVSREDAAALNAKAPTAADIRTILQFGRDCFISSKATPTHLLVHCNAGASRSPAAAYAILCLWLGKNREIQAKDQLLRIRQDVVPNPMVVAYADRLLGREGKMLEAIRTLYAELNEDIDRGIAPSEAKPEIQPKSQGDASDHAP